ncbi:hypothetical protein B0H16DRAFT_726462 [Mycena metata]|uniref:Glycosyltransferase subfamily 4-like N-terminal domain-containing protein n=1 Tax=Mycena metata TaxID=1033252 RepID=A0AAD7K974_9AGAR|nr:hypothetical protein B0H16DRAFT_726462 [Mycena metata]
MTSTSIMGGTGSTSRTTALPILPLHAERLRVAIIAENFLPKIDGSTITLAHLLTHLQTCGLQAMLFGPEGGMSEYAGAPLFGTFGVPLRVYPGLKVNFLSPPFLAALRAFAPHVIHLVDPIWLGVQALVGIKILFPHVPIITSHHTNLATYAEVFGCPYWGGRVWQIHAYLHSFAHTTLVPSHSTAALLAEKGFANLRVVGRGVDRYRADSGSAAARAISISDSGVEDGGRQEGRDGGIEIGDGVGGFSPTLRSQTLRASCGATPSTTIILSVGRLSPEKNLTLLVEAFAILPPSIRNGRPANHSGGNGKVKEGGAKLVFVGDGPWAGELRGVCCARGLRCVDLCVGVGAAGKGDVESADVVFTGQLTGRALGEAFASADVMSSPSITETFGQVTLQGMASGLPVVGLYVEGTADLVTHLETGLLLDVHACAPPPPRASGWGSLLGLGAASSCSTSRGSAIDDNTRKAGFRPIPERTTSDDTKPWAPLCELSPHARVASYSSCHHMMQASTSSAPSSLFFSAASTSSAWPTIAGRYACLLETLIAGDEGRLLREEMGRRAYERSQAFTWEGCSGRMVQAYVDAVGWGAYGTVNFNDGGVEVEESGSASTSTSPTLEPSSPQLPPSPTPTLVSAGFSPTLSPKFSALSPMANLSSASLLLPPPILDPAELSLTNVHAHTLSLSPPLTPSTHDSITKPTERPLAFRHLDTRVPRAQGVVGQQWKALPAPLQTVVDAFVVVHALFAATMTHAAYMVPTVGDLVGGAYGWGR